MATARTHRRSVTLAPLDNRALANLAGPLDANLRQIEAADETADELAEMLYHSLNKLRDLPDTTLVYPAHGAGSMCGKNLSKETVSTIGEQKRFNYALQPMNFDDFKRLVTSNHIRKRG